MIVALIALVFAMTGTGIAAKTLITGKQIKDGSITSKDLAKGAVAAVNLQKNAVGPTNLQTNAVTADKIADSVVSTRKLANQAVTGEKVAPGAIGSAALAAQSVTTAALTPGSVSASLCDNALGAGATTPVYCGAIPHVCPNATIVYGSDPCPADPSWDLKLDGTDVPLTPGTTFDSGNPAIGTCRTRQPIPMKARVDGTHTVALDAGTYEITATATWHSGGGTMRAIDIIRQVAAANTNLRLGGAMNPPTPSGATTQTITLTTHLDSDDLIKINAFSCGVLNDTLDAVDVKVHWVSSP